MYVRFCYRCQNCEEEFYHDMEVPKIRGIESSLIMAKKNFNEKVAMTTNSLDISPPDRYMTHNCSSDGVVGVGEIVCGCEISKDKFL